MRQPDDEDPDSEIKKLVQSYTDDKEEGNQGLTVCGINAEMLETKRTKQRCLEVRVLIL